MGDRIFDRGGDWVGDRAAIAVGPKSIDIYGHGAGLDSGPLGHVASSAKSVHHPSPIFPIWD